MVDGRVDHVVVFGVVARVGKQLVLRLTDSSRVVLPRGRHLRVGAIAHIVVRFARVAAGGSSADGRDRPRADTRSFLGVGCAKVDCTFDVTGNVTAVDDASGAVTVTPLGGGAALTAQPGTVNTDDVFVGDFVHIAGTQSASTGVYTLTTLDELPGCDTPDCT